MKDFFRDERKALAALLAAAFAVRLAASLTSLVIEHDGARFTQMARYLADGRWDEGLDLWPRMSPLYPLLIAGLGTGAPISVILGTLSVLPVYMLARAVWDRRVATLAGGIVGFLPDSVHLGGAVMSEAPFCFLFFTAMELARRAAEHARWRDWALAGISGGLAALMRPEGVYFVAAVAGWTLVRAIRLRGWGRRAAGVALALVAFAVFVAPYARWIHAKTGRWDVSDSPFAQGLKHKLGLAKEPAAIDPLEGMVVNPATEYEEGRMSQKYGHVLGRLIHYNEQIIRVCGYGLYPFLLLGFLQLRRRPGDWFVFAVGLGYVLPPMVMLLADLPFSHRYVMPGVLFWAPIMALGLVTAGSWCARWVPEPRRVAVAAVVLAAMAVPLAIKGAKPSGANRRTLADAGRWIRERAGPRPVILANDRRIAHYADGYSEIAPARFDDLPRAIERTHAQWIAMVDSLIDRQPGYREGLDRAYALSHVVPKSRRGDAVRIYRIPGHRYLK